MNKDNKTEELLCEVYRNVKMGQNSLCDVTGKVSDKFLLKDITSQINRYAEFTGKCEKIMREECITPKEESPMKRFMAKSGIMMNTLLDDSNAHIAEMIVKGTDMGADRLEQIMHSCKKQGCSAEAVSLCENVISFERSAVGQMKDYTAR